MKKQSNSKSVKVLMMNLGLTAIMTCTIVLIISCSNSAKRAEYCKDSLMKDSFMKDSITKIMAAEEAKLTDIHTNTPADRKFIKTAELKFRVNNVLYATEKIEDLTAKYGGYMIYSNLANRHENSERSKISRDSILISKQILVENQLQLKVPTQNLDSFVRSLKPLVTFLDYRIIKLNDVTLQFISSQKKTDRLQNYEKRQTQHIDSKAAKLYETINAEDILLERQNQSDDLKLQSMALDDQVKYCNLTIEIYQKPIITKETVANFDYVSDVKPNFVARMWDSAIQGWNILEEVVVFLIKIWGIAALIIGIVFGLRYLGRWYRKIK
jgi:hypothetical protein